MMLDRYDPPVEALSDIAAVEDWLRWCQSPDGGRMAFDFALSGRDYVVFESGNPSFSDEVADAFDRARDRALAVIREQNDDRDPDLVLLECMEPDTPEEGDR